MHQGTRRSKLAPTQNLSRYPVRLYDEAPKHSKCCIGSVEIYRTLNREKGKKENLKKHAELGDMRFTCKYLTCIHHAYDVLSCINKLINQFA